MKLSQLAAKPKLIEITIDDAEIIAEFGEAITFHTWDRQPIGTFLKMAAVDADNYSSIVDTVRELVLDEDGKQILTQDATLPTKVMMKVVGKVVDGLGK
jgi:hypothetical protein